MEQQAKPVVLPAVLALRGSLAARVILDLAVAAVERPPLGKANQDHLEHTAALAATFYQRGRRPHPLETAAITPAVVALATLPELTPAQPGLAALAAVGMAGIKPLAPAVAAVGMATILILRRGQLIPAVAAGRTLTIHLQAQVRREDLE